jgi:hypothetical protein
MASNTPRGQLTTSSIRNPTCHGRNALKFGLSVGIVFLIIRHAINMATKFRPKRTDNPKIKMFGDDKQANPFIKRKQSKGY